MPSSTIRVETGRLRRVVCSAYMICGLFGGWIWFGNTGAALLGLLAWLGWPPAVILIELPIRPRSLKLGRYAITWGEGFGGLLKRQRLFRDEVTPEEFARLRRQLVRGASP